MDEKIKILRIKFLIIPPFQIEAPADCVWSISLLSPSLFAHISHNRYLQTFTRLSASQIFSASLHRRWCAARHLSETSIICSECSPSLQPHPQTSLRSRTTSPTPPDMFTNTQLNACDACFLVVVLRGGKRWRGGRADVKIDSEFI